MENIKARTKAPNLDRLVKTGTSEQIAREVSSSHERVAHLLTRVIYRRECLHACTLLRCTKKSEQQSLRYYFYRLLRALRTECIAYMPLFITVTINFARNRMSKLLNALINCLQTTGTLVT